MITPEILIKLIGDGETLTVEFKSDRKPLPENELVEAVVCLANKHGGKLVIGVEDDGCITGLNQKLAESSPGLLSALIASKTTPSLSVETAMIDLPEGRVAVINVPTAPQLVSTSNGRTLIRRLDTRGKPQCQPLYANEIDSWYADRGQRDVTARLITGTTWDDLDPLEFVRLRRLLSEYRGDISLQDLSDRELAQALGFVRGDDLVPTLAGLLVIGRESVLSEQVPTHEVAFQVLRGQDVAINEFYRWPLLRVFERIMEAFSLRNEENELTVDLFRVGVPAYDPRAFREAVNNALTHRDYNRIGAVHIQTHDDALVIRNPGGFVEGIQLDSLLVSGPLPRNPLLADIFKRIGLVERTGRGIGLIYSGQLRTGHPLPDYSATTNSNVIVRLPGGKADLDFVKIILAEERRLKRLLTLDELILLNYLRQEGEINIVEAGRLTQKGESNARRVLEELMENGLVERIKTARQREYHLSASVYRQMGRPAAYVRRRGFEELQMEQMIVQYISKHERITRTQTAELCRINGSQATYLLSKLARRGLLCQMGIGGRSAYYILTKDANVSVDLIEDAKPHTTLTQNIDIPASDDSKVTSLKPSDAKPQPEQKEPIQLELDL
ncbi:MAG: RNA-binding domain-containing protein [Nostoc sp.]|uniref:RNA-binding domain-containing protein n=1 Tax=Nostoc sp. TaxID=1180 RepID=UPI002FF2285C